MPQDNVVPFRQPTDAATANDNAFAPGFPTRINSLANGPTERLNRADVYGVPDPAVMKIKMRISSANTSNTAKFPASPECTYYDVMTRLSTVRKGPKDGLCMVGGVMFEDHRGDRAVLKMHMGGLDIEDGSYFNETVETAMALGDEFIAYETHSSGKSAIDFDKDAFVKWANRVGIEPEPTVEAVKRYLGTKRKWNTDLIESTHEVSERRTKDGTKIVAHTRPYDRFRIMYPFAEPFQIGKVGGSQSDEIKTYGDIILGMGALLGVRVDSAARNISRLFYTPSEKPGPDKCRIVINHGRARHWKDIAPVTVKEHNLRFADPFEAAGEAMAGSDRGKAKTPSGASMEFWAGLFADHFHIAKAFEDHVEEGDERWRGEKGPHKHEFCCPFDDEHGTDPGNPEDKACFFQSAGDEPTFAFSCRHDSCQGLDRLDLLAKAIEAEWIPESVLTDPKYTVMGDAEFAIALVKFGDGRTGEDRESLDEVLARAVAEKASDGFVSSPTMDALMNCVARETNRVPIFDRIKASKITTMLDFKKEVESRAKAFAKEAAYAKRAKEGKDLPGEDHHYVNLVEGIRAMNEAIALIERGSGVVFYQKRETGDPWKSKESAPLIYLPWTYGKDFTPLFPDWLKSSHRDHRTDIVFNPYCHGSEDITPADHLNLFKGLALEPVKGDCADYYRHVFHIICGGNKRLFTYVIGWLAQMVQQPEFKPGTALVLRGLKGIGKGIFVDALRPIWGRHSVKVSDPKQLTGNFNGHMDAKILAIAEEAFFGGDRKVDSIVKDMITSDRMMLERKFMDAVELPDYRRFIFLSNAENVVRATPDERRYAVTLVNPERMHDRAYWNHFVSRIANGGLPAALAYDLLNLDLDVDLRSPPRTAALMDQILANLPAEDRWLRGVMEAGAFLDKDGVTLGTGKLYDQWKTQAITIGKDVVYESYRAEVSTYYGKEVSPDKIGKYFVGMFRETENGESLIHTTGESRTGREYVLPPLPELRAFYEKSFLKLDSGAADNEADFIRVQKPQIGMYPHKPDTNGADEWKRYEADCQMFDDERAEVRKEADAFIRDMLGLEGEA